MPSRCFPVIHHVYGEAYTICTRHQPFATSLEALRYPPVRIAMCRSPFGVIVTMLACYPHRPDQQCIAVWTPGRTRASTTGQEALIAIVARLDSRAIQATIATGDSRDSRDNVGPSVRTLRALDRGNFDSLRNRSLAVRHLRQRLGWMIRLQRAISRIVHLNAGLAVTKQVGQVPVGRVKAIQKRWLYHVGASEQPAPVAQFDFHGLTRIHLALESIEAKPGRLRHCPRGFSELPVRQ